MRAGLKQFIKIDNRFFDPEYNYFNKLGTEGFSIYCYIKIKQGQSAFVDLSIKQIKSFLESEYCFKNTRTVKKYLNNLITHKLIFVDSIKEDYKIGDFHIFRDNQELFKQEEEKKIGFTPINTDLFADEIKQIGSNGWAILCLLTNLFNSNYGQSTCEGFANPSEDYIAKVLDIGVTTVKKYLKILEERKLIKIEEQDPIVIVNKHGEDVKQYLSNHYIVKNRLVDNKYYIVFEKNKENKVSA